MRPKCFLAILFLILVLWSQRACPVLAEPGLSLKLKAAPLHQVFDELQKHGNTKLQAHKDIAGQKVHLFTQEVSAPEAMEKLCALRGYEVIQEKDGTWLLRESEQHRALARQMRQEARRQQLKKLKKRWEEILAALREGDPEALRQSDPALAQSLGNLQWNAQFGLMLQLSPPQRQALLSGRNLSFTVPDLPSDIQEMFLDAVGRSTTRNGAGEIQWSTDILREVGKVQFVHGGSPEEPTLYLRIYND